MLTEWLQLVGSIKLQVSFAKELYKRDYVLQKRPIILYVSCTVSTWEGDRGLNNYDCQSVLVPIMFFPWTDFDAYFSQIVFWMYSRTLHTVSRSAPVPRCIGWQNVLHFRDTVSSMYSRTLSASYAYMYMYLLHQSKRRRGISVLYVE